MLFLSIFDPASPTEIAFIVLGGLGIFLFGISLMSSSLKSLAGKKLKVLVGRATGTVLKGIITGVVVSTLIQSSTATTVIVIGLISAGLLTFRQSLGVMIGSNIGTTVTAFLIGLKVSEYSFIIVAIGAVLFLFFARRKLNLAGSAILGFGLLFVGLELMSRGLVPLSKEDWFSATMTSLSNYPILGVATGAGLTALVQSSSASIGILQQLFFNDSVQIKGALSILLGCNIGTTITAILASLGGTTESKQAAFFHTLFNVFGTILFLIFLTPYVKLFAWLEISVLGMNNKLTIAFAHMFFNTTTSIFVIFLTRYFAIFVQKIIPSRKKDSSLSVDKLNEDLLHNSPVLALESAKLCIDEMGDIAREMIYISHKYLNKDDESYYDKCLVLEDQIDYFDHKLHDYLMQMQSFNLSANESMNQVIFLDTIRDLERIGDHCVNLVEFFRSRYTFNSKSSEESLENLNFFFKQILTQVDNALTSFRDNNPIIARSVLQLEVEIDKLERKYRRAQLNEIGICPIPKISVHLDDDGVFTPTRNDVHFVDILSNLERISDHCCNIAENIIDPHYMNKEKALQN